MSENMAIKKLPLDGRHVHCVGIGGIGVSAIAEWLLEAGYSVSGSDIELNAACRELSDAGAVIAPAGHRKENLPDTHCAGAIITAAAELSNPETAELLRNNVMVWKRGEFLGEISRCYHRPVMVAGSHGKSSTAAMLGWIMQKNSIDAGLLLGARYNGPTRRTRCGNGDILIAEADESDHTLIMLKSHLALITNLDGDHAWTPEELQAQEKQFAYFARNAAHTLYIGSEKCNAVLGSFENCHALSGESLQRLLNLVPAWMLGYERMNAALAIAAAEYLQAVSATEAAAALNDYPGIGRRQSVVFSSENGNLIVLEDYAHHPTELAASLEVIKARYANRKPVIFFQPHRYQRLQKYFHEFKNILSDPAIEVKLLPVFSAWENPQLDVPDSLELAKSINNSGGRATALGDDYLSQASAIAMTLSRSTEPVLAAFIGAGDISKLSSATVRFCQNPDIISSGRK